MQNRQQAITHRYHPNQHAQQCIQQTTLKYLIIRRSVYHERSNVYNKQIYNILFKPHITASWNVQYMLYVVQDVFICMLQYLYGSHIQFRFRFSLFKIYSLFSAILYIIIYYMFLFVFIIILRAVFLCFVWNIFCAHKQIMSILLSLGFVVSYMSIGFILNSLAWSSVVVTIRTLARTCENVAHILNRNIFSCKCSISWILWKIRNILTHSVRLVRTQYAAYTRTLYCMILDFVCFCFLRCCCFLWSLFAHYLPMYMRTDAPLLEPYLLLTTFICIIKKQSTYMFI